MFKRKVALLLCAAALACVTLHAETFGVSPTGYLTASLGGAVQLTATGTGGAAVTWSIVGNSTLGTITSNGLYTAPASMPLSNAIPIKAALTANSATSATTYIYLLSAGPVISSVSPNPILAGTVNVSIQGTGFLTGATVMLGAVQMSTSSITSTVIKAVGYVAAGTTSTTFSVKNLSSSYSNVLTVPVTSSGSGDSGGGSTPTVQPSTVTVALGAAQQFTAAGATSWTAVSGSITSAGLYTAPTLMPASGSDTVTAKNAKGQSSAMVTLVSSTPPGITSVANTPLPLGVFSTTVTGVGFTAASVAKLNGIALTTSYTGATSFSISGFAGPAVSESLTIANGAIVSQPFSVAVGVQNPLVSVSAARRFLEQAAFGPTPLDAAHVQQIGFSAWIDEQLAMPAVSNYNAVSGSQGGLAVTFLANAVTNPDQLRQRLAFALSQIFVTSITKVIWNGDMVPYQQMLIGDAFSNYRNVLGDVTLSPAMGLYLDMANNAKANPAAGTAANENYAREVMQLFSLGDVMLNQDGTVQVDANNQPAPAYLQTGIAELARVFTGWTYTPKSGNTPVWGSYINSAGPMVPFPAQHDPGSKTLLNGYVAPANLTAQQDLDGALDNIASHPNVAPFISKQLIQHLVKSNPTPAYVSRVAQVFTQGNGNLGAVVKAILLDTEARANDAGGNDQPSDGHLQEPALFIPGFVRAFGGQMTTANYYQSTLAGLGEDIFNPASVFNYFSPGYTVAGTGGLKGPEFQIDNPNSALLRENVIAQFFSQYSNLVASYGPGTTVNLTPFVALAGNPQALVGALDITLTHGTMPAAMNAIVVNAVAADTGTALHKTQTACYLILTSSYYNVWH